MKNIIFFIVISIFTTIGWAVTNIKSPIPLSTLTDFTCQYQAPNYLKIETKIADDILLQDEITDLIVDEFVNSDNYLIYQSKLITTSSEDIELKIVAIDSVTIPISKYPEINNADESQHLPFAYFGKSGIMHGLKVMPLIVRQYRYDKNSHSLVSYKNIEIELKSNNNFDAYRDHLFISPSWSQFFQNTILNYQADETMTFSSGLPKGYLIIVTDALYNTILPFAQWKNQKGWTVTVKRKSEIGTTSAAIKNYIAQAYATWTPKIEYVLLVGNATDIPPISSSQTVGDHLYACVDGDDLYPDLFVGRFPTSSTSELSVMVAKSIGYEQSPHLADTLWYKRALMVATTYQSSGVPVWTALVTKRWVRNLLINHNYYQVDTVFHPPISNGVGVIDTIINRGVTFVNGRGWGNREGWSYPYFKFQDVANLNNGWKLPIVTSFYCATGNFTATTNFGTTWLIAGSPTQPRGGVAFYGPIYATTSTRFNNCHDYGVYFGIFEEGITNLGPALFRGKIEMLNNFPMASDTLALTTHVCTYNILGDPSLEMWYGTTPKQFVVNYPNQLPIGSSQLTISVQNSNNQPVANALVSIFKNNEVKQISYTNESGLALFNFLTQTQDTLFVTVTKHNFLPHRGNVQIIPSALYVGYYNHSGSIIAGQTNNIMISLKNYGTTQTAYNTFATLRSSDNYITILDSTKSFGDIAPNQISINGPFQFIVATNCTNNHRINFQIAITSTSNSWQAGFNGIVRSAELSYKSHSVVDGNNNILEPNETANLIVKVYNRGLENISNVSAILRSANPYAIQVLDSIGYYGTINVGDSIQNSSDYFTIHAASSLAIGRKIYLQLVLRNSSYERIVEFPITIGNINFTAPLGPDQYGYWAYDNTDLAYAECPTYNWIEIDPNYGGNGTRLSMPNNSIRVINLPFTFKYYGNNYNRISIASNGYMAMDSTWIIDMYNWSIPSPMGPPALIAPFWDYFHPETLSSSGIYYHYDAANHRFIIQWSRIHHMHGFRNPYPAEQQTFQVLLLNPTYYPTRTGDGPIIFQYHTVFNDDSASVDCHNYATVGIESPNLLDGIEYTFANHYPSAAAIIEPGRAIKFTTNPPDTFTAIKELNHYVINNPKFFSIFPNPIKSYTNFYYSLSHDGMVSLKVYDITGKIKLNLIDNKYHSAGQYQLKWQNQKIPAGIYFAILSIKNNDNKVNQKIKMILN